MQLSFLFYFLNSFISTNVFAQSNTNNRLPSDCANTCNFNLVGTKATSDGLINSFYIGIRPISSGTYSNKYYYRRLSVNTLGKLVLIENVEMLGDSISNANWRSTLYQGVDLNNSGLAASEIITNAANTNDALNGTNWDITATHTTPSVPYQVCYFGYKGQLNCFTDHITPGVTYISFVTTNQSSVLDFTKRYYEIKYGSGKPSAYNPYLQLWSYTLSSAVEFLKAFQPFQAVMFIEGGDAPLPYLNLITSISVND